MYNYITFLRGSDMEKTKSLLDWHTTHHIEVSTLDGGRSYYVISKGEDINGFLDTISKHANIEGWGVIEKEGTVMVPTYAYDRILVASLPGSVSIATLKCMRCRHAWHPRSHEPPERCPKCNSPYWDKPRSK
jgi:hypothetical protein